MDFVPLFWALKKPSNKLNNRMLEGFSFCSTVTLPKLFARFLLFYGVGFVGFWSRCAYFHL